MVHIGDRCGRANGQQLRQTILQQRQPCREKLRLAGHNHSRWHCLACGEELIEHRLWCSTGFLACLHIRNRPLLQLPSGVIFTLAIRKPCRRYTTALTLSFPLERGEIVQPSRTDTGNSDSDDSTTEEPAPVTPQAELLIGRSGVNDDAPNRLADWSGTERRCTAEARTEWDAKAEEYFFIDEMDDVDVKDIHRIVFTS